jgi:SAM-dependent methyltransferase
VLLSSERLDEKPAGIAREEQLRQSGRCDAGTTSASWSMGPQGDAGRVSLLCPQCLRELHPVPGGRRCDGCERVYPEKGGVVCLLPAEDEFYEGAYQATVNITFPTYRSLKALFYFSIYRDPYFRALRQYVPENSHILDIGCGGGIRYLAQKGDVVGLDLSAASLRKVTDFYRLAVQVDALKMPFPDATFDIVTSCYFFEHLRPQEKRALLTEAHRVLKPGGRLILMFDCDNNNRLFRWIKKDPASYQQGFVEHDRHVGLELPTVNLAHLGNAGFSVIGRWGLNKTVVQYLPVYGWLASCRERSFAVRSIHRVAEWVGRHKYLWVPYYMFVNWFDALANAVLPLNHARVLLVVARRSWA